MRAFLTPLIWSVALVSVCEGREVRFNRDIRPLLSDNCFACHGPHAQDAKAGLQLHSLEAATAPLESDEQRRAIVPRSRTKSVLWERITATDPDERMPPVDSHHQLSPEEIELFGLWIDQGAVYEGHWSLQPRGKATGTIDSFVDAGIERAGLEPQPKADRSILLRRLYQDLTGLPPGPEKVRAFLSDENPPSYEKVVDQLLASDACAERLTVDWLDGARYADTNGYSIDDHRDMWVWRDWVIDAFRKNKPFDEFAVEQIAGDLLPNANEQQRVATGFLRNSMNTHEGGTIAEEYRVTYTADKVDTVATVFMGLTMKCAQCHDHKYDPITQREYYQFFAFFNTSSEPGGGATNANTRPLIEASSPLCSTERIKSDVAHRLSELDYLRVHPPVHLYDARAEWITEQRRTLSPNSNVSQSLELFPKKEPSWIWTADNHTAAKAEFRRSFTLGTKPQEAKLWVSCDNSCRVKVNGKEVTAVKVWMKPQLAVVSNLVAGENVIEVSGVNDDPPGAAGLLLSLAIREKNGQAIHVATDKQWQARVVGTEKWVPAAELHPHGKGPWKVVYRRDGNGGESPDLVAALMRDAPERSMEDWNRINDVYAKKSGAFKTFLNQLNLEAKVLKKARETGRSTVMVMDYKPRKTHILIRGAYDQHGDEVQAGTPQVLPPLPGPGEGSANRLHLAQWLVDPVHPLTARVIVNRYWQMLFGTGLVRTAEDFGAQGEYPSHPELLDWLASDFVAHGWDVRRLLKQIVMSQAYQRSSAVTKELLAKDPYNRLLARAPRYRLAAEFVRDSALAASGLLRRNLGGPSVYPWQPEGLWAEVSHYGYPHGFTAQKFLPGMGKGVYRRSMYTAWKRTSPPPAMAIFDAPNRETCVVRRLSTNTPLQALVLQNDPQFVSAARALGVELAKAGSLGNGIEEGALRVLGRMPRQRESAILSAAWRRYHAAYRARAKDAQELLKKAPVFAGDSDVLAEQAAWTLVASTLLNMDEAVTRQ